MDDRYGRGVAPGHLDEETLSAYLDADTDPTTDLTPAARAAADAHLAACATCREALGELRATVALLGALPQLAPRRSFALTPEAIEAAGGRVPREPAGRRRLGWVWPVRWASALVALVFALTIGLDARMHPAVPVGTAVPAGALATASAQAAATGAAGRATEPADRTEQIVVLGQTPEIFPTPTAAAQVAPVVPAESGPDWLLTEIGLGVLALALAFAGFLLPPLLRRRGTASP